MAMIEKHLDIEYLGIQDLKIGLDGKEGCTN